ncbi:MAG: type II toxin-antitoxin system HicB family antitoxin [Nitrososphaerales archaeon]
MAVYNFTIRVKREEDSGWYIVRCEELPGAISQGKNLDEAMNNIKEAIIGYIEAFPEEFEKIRESIEIKNKEAAHKLPLEIST